MSGRAGWRGPATELSLLGTARRDWTGGEPSTDRLGLRLETVHRPQPRLQLRGTFDVGTQNCRDCDWRDGPIQSASLDTTWVLTPTLRLNAGADWQRARSDAESWRSTAAGGNLGATLSLPWGFTVSAEAGLRRTRYGGSGIVHRTIDQEPRADRDRTLSASVFNRALTVFGFSPRISVQNQKRRTNAQALDYTRTAGELSFVRQF